MEKNYGKTIAGIIAVIIFFAFIFWPSGDSESDLTGNTINSQNLAKFESEVGQVGTSLTMYKVINRNDYPWHNVEIVVNDYYSCWDRSVLEPGNSITVNAQICDRFVYNHQIVESIWIESDEGAERYSLR